ncbi:MAG: carbamate kinase [Candidatus Hadarchaeota archaeon]
MRLLVALGGNAIKQAKETGTTLEQFINCKKTAVLLAKVVKRMGPNDRLIITHGNGPQVGNLAVQQDLAKAAIPPQDLDILGAMTQGQIGYMLVQMLDNQMKDLGVNRPAISVVNRVQVSKNDPEFTGENASKPVGNFLAEEEAKEVKAKHPEYIFKKVKPGEGKVWRRVVPSPDPIINVEAEAIRKLVDAGVIVVASGGGGIPVVLDPDGHNRGVEAVIDKDLAGEKLAEVVNADTFLILSDVEKVKLNFGKPNEKGIDRMTVSEAEKYLKEGHFLAGSMGPKVKACIRFVKWGGKRAIISALDKVTEALDGKTGTEIIPG